MRLRRGRLLSALLADEVAPTLVSFPLMGVGDFVSPSAPPGGEASESDFVPDTCSLYACKKCMLMHAYAECVEFSLVFSGKWYWAGPVWIKHRL
jgi:hypothetical protein